MANPADMLVEIAPEFKGEDWSRLNMFIEIAASRISTEIFGVVYVQAVAYLAAHLLSVSARATSTGTASAGPVTSASTGGVSITLGDVAASFSTSDAALSTTAYGLEYLALRNSRAGTKMKIIRP